MKLQLEQEYRVQVSEKDSAQTVETVQPIHIDEALPSPSLHGVKLNTYSLESITKYFENGFSDGEDQQDRIEKVSAFLEDSLQNLNKLYATLPESKRKSFKPSMDQAQEIIDFLTIKLQEAEPLISLEDIESMIKERDFSGTLDLYTSIHDRFWLDFESDDIRERLQMIEQQVAERFTPEEIESYHRGENKYTLGTGVGESFSLEEIQDSMFPEVNEKYMAERTETEKLLAGDAETLRSMPEYRKEEIMKGAETEHFIAQELLQIPDVVAVLELPSQSKADHSKVDLIAISIHPDKKYSTSKESLEKALFTVKKAIEGFSKSLNGNIGSFEFSIRPELADYETHYSIDDIDEAEKLLLAHKVQVKSQFSGAKNAYEKNTSGRTRYNNIMYISPKPESNAQKGSVPAQLRKSAAIGMGLSPLSK